MARTKGSKNKKKSELVYNTVAEVDARLEQLSSEIDELSNTLKSRKTEMKELVKTRASIEAAEAEARAEAAKQELIAVIEESGKSYEDVIRMIKGE